MNDDELDDFKQELLRNFGLVGVCFILLFFYNEVPAYFLVYSFLGMFQALVVGIATYGVAPQKAYCNQLADRMLGVFLLVFVLQQLMF